MEAEHREQALQVSHIGTWSMDAASRQIDLDAIARELLSINDRMPVSIDAFLRLIVSEDEGIVRWALDRLSVGETAGPVRFRVAEDPHRQIEMLGAPGDHADGWSIVGTMRQVEDAAAIHQRSATDAGEDAVVALRASEERMRIAAAACRLATFEFDIHSNTSYWSPEFAALVGRPGQRTASAAEFQAIVYPEDVESVRQLMVAAAAADSPRHYQAEYRIQLPDGEVRWVRDCGQRLVDGFNQPLRVVGALQDITEQREAEEMFLEDDRRKNEFIAMLSHELRNPLTPIKTSLELQRQAPDDPIILEKTRELMSRQVEHLVRLVDDLLDVSRITRGHLQLRVREGSLFQILSTAVDSCETWLQSRQQTLHQRLPDEDVVLEVDTARITQVVLNLLTNASKFTPDGGNIILAADINPEEVSISVTDDGIGIEPARQEEIFHLFRQVESEDAVNEGLGIGLTLVRSLTEMHGGRVDMYSEGLTRGSTFRVTLPRRPPPED